MKVKRLQDAARHLPTVVGCSLLIVACGNDRPAADAGPALPAAADLREQTIKPVSEYLTETTYANASGELGDRLLQQCRACHTLNPGGSHMLGPNLHGIFGRQAGSIDGFPYTRALLGADFVWTPRALDAWLARPQQFLPGNAMAFGGLQYADDRAAVIASLMRETSVTADANTE